MKNNRHCFEKVILIINSIFMCISVIAVGCSAYFLYHVMYTMRAPNLSYTHTGDFIQLSIFKLNKNKSLNGIIKDIGYSDQELDGNSTQNSSAGVITVGYDNAYDKLSKANGVTEVGMSMLGFINFYKSQPDIQKIGDSQYPQSTLGQLTTKYLSNGSYTFNLNLNLKSYLPTNEQDNQINLSMLISNNPDTRFIYVQKSNYSLIILFKLMAVYNSK